MELLDAVSVFLRSCRLDKNLSEHTLRAYEIDLRQFTAFVLGKSIREFHQISGELLQEFVELLKTTKGQRDSSIRRKLAVIRAFAKFLREKEIIPTDPLAVMKVTFKQARRLPSVLGRSEIHEILHAAKEAVRTAAVSNAGKFQAARNYAFLELLFYSGARVSEILKLDLLDCDLENGFAKIKGKGRRERIVHLGCDPVVAALRAYLAVRDLSGSQGMALFINRSGGRLSIYSAERIVKTFANAAGVSARVTPHVFRHTMATMMLENGADLRSIQEILGHASLATTELYTHVSTERKRNVMMRFHPRQSFERTVNAE